MNNTMLKQTKYKLFLLMMLLLTYSSSFAQTGEVTGTIIDANDKSTIPGASILIKGTVMGTTSDINGVFHLSVKPNTTLVISFVGYKTQEVVVQPNTNIEVILNFEVTALEELVVIGYGVQKKSDRTGAVQSITAAEMNSGVLTDPIQDYKVKSPV